MIRDDWMGWKQQLTKIIDWLIDEWSLEVLRKISRKGSKKSAKNEFEWSEKAELTTMESLAVGEACQALVWRDPGFNRNIRW